MAIREGRWDCESCGIAGNLGRAVHCPGCGLPRPDGTRFYLPEDAEEVTDAARLAQARAGADWVCEHCGASARATDEDCPGCGAPRGDSGTQDVHEYAMDEIPRDGRKRRPRPLAAAAPTAPKRYTGRILLVALVLLGWLFFRKREIEGVVEGTSWTRTTEIEAYRTLRESGFNLPEGARPVRSYRAVERYNQVLDHYVTRERQVSERVQTGSRTYTCGSRDTGNGYFEDVTCTEPTYETRYRSETYEDPVYRQEPVYGTKHDYDIDRWVRDTVLTTRGEAHTPADTAGPRWPAPRLRDRQREAAKTEEYVVRYKGENGKTYEHKLPFDRFRDLRIGSPVRLKVSASGSSELIGIDSTKIRT